MTSEPDAGKPGRTHIGLAHIAINGGAARHGHATRQGPRQMSITLSHWLRMVAYPITLATR